MMNGQWQKLFLNVPLSICHYFLPKFLVNYLTVSRFHILIIKKIMIIYKYTVARGELWKRKVY